MAYKLHERKIIPGGLNLAPPEDQTAENDSLVLDGWWPSSIGKLQQTRGQTSRSVAVAAEAHSIAEENGRVYFGSASSLYQIGRAAGAAIQTGFDGQPLGLLGFQNYMWIMNRSLQLRDNGTTLIPWGVETPPAAPTHALATGEHLPDGFYDYFVTWVDNGFFESNPSPVLQIDTGAGADDWKITITRPTATDPTRIFGWNVYRRSPGTYAVYKVNVNVIAPYSSVTDYVDEGALGGAAGQSAEVLIGRGEELGENHDAPPAARVLADAPFNGRIIAASTAAYPNRLYYTESGQPSFFPLDNFVDCGDDTGDEILRVSVKPGMLIIYRQRSIWRHIGDFDDDTARIEAFVPELGIVSANAVAPTARGDFFIGGREGVADGVYLLADWPEKVSKNIEPIFQEFQLPWYGLLTQSQTAKCALGYNAGRLWFSYPTGGNRQTFILDVETRRWFANQFAAAAYSVFYNGGQFFYAGWGVQVVSLEDGLTINGSGIFLDYKTPYLDCGYPDNEKTWADLVITHHTHSVTLYIGIRINNNRTGGGIDEFVLATISSATLTRQVIPLVYPNTYATVAVRGKPIKALNLSVEITGTGPTGGFLEIDSPILLHYYLEARKGVTFDSGITDHGTPAFKMVDQVEIDLDASAGAATLQIGSDYPDAVVVDRLGAGLAIAQTDGRQVVTIVLETPIEGKLLRYQLATDTALQVYGFRARVLPIGVFLDGTVEDLWKSEPLAAGA